MKPRDTMGTKKRGPLVQALIYVWVLPNSLLGLCVGLLGLITGGKFQFRCGCVEFYGGFVTWSLVKIRVMAMTLGHTIIGQRKDELAIVREHEQVHVSQYERWGPFFIPAYLWYSALLWLQKRDCYMENPFEVEAYRLADPRKKRNPKD